MSRFCIGQRVRVKWSNNFPELSAKVGTVVSLAPNPMFTFEPGCQYEVAMDCWDGSSLCPEIKNGEIAIFCPSGDQLEPATDSYDKIEWSECVWQPERLLVGS